MTRDPYFTPIPQQPLRRTKLGLGTLAGVSALADENRLARQRSGLTKLTLTTMFYLSFQTVLTYLIQTKTRQWLPGGRGG
jgi:hypothetical protein